MFKKVVYIAGPMTSSGDYKTNIRLGVKVMRALMKMGYSVICPQLSGLTDFDTVAWKARELTGDLTHDDWYEMDLELVRRSDLLLRLPGESRGADKEVAEAERRGIKVYHKVCDIWYFDCKCKSWKDKPGDELTLLDRELERASDSPPRATQILQQEYGFPVKAEPPVRVECSQSPFLAQPKVADTVGHAGYLKLLDEMAALHKKKAQDYGTDSDPFANIRASEELGIPADKGAWLRAKDKVKRLDRHYNGKPLANESAADSLIDLAAYCLIAEAIRREKCTSSVPAAKSQ